MANNIKLETLYMSGNFPNMVSLAFAKVLFDNLDIKFIKETNNTKKLNMEFKLPNYTLVSNYWEKEVVSIMMPKIVEKLKREMSPEYNVYLHKCNIDIDEWNNKSTVILEYIRDLKQC